MKRRIASGDEKSVSLQLFNFSFPTKESAEKIVTIQIECDSNKPFPKLNDRTPYEDVVLNKSATNFFDTFPIIKEAPVFKYYQQILKLNEKEFGYKSVYSKTGGVLNFFNPKIRESMDSELKTLLSRCEEEKEAIRLWKDRPSELWSNLTPKLVWAGGGVIEMKLLLDFSRYLTRMVRRKKFDTRGDAIITAIRNLREWQFQPNGICSGMAPIDAIIKERAEIYKRKSAFLEENHIECDFL
jgi:hypothetical protein